MHPEAAHADMFRLFAFVLTLSELTLKNPVFSNYTGYPSSFFMYLSPKYPDFLKVWRLPDLCGYSDFDGCGTAEEFHLYFPAA